MPSINKEFLELLQDDYKKYDCLIETGTYMGETIFGLEPYFNKLYTIEFSEKYYNNTKKRYHGKKINFILGDSGIVFETLLPTIRNKSIFFLDGHWSSGDTGHSTKDSPLEEELIHINNLFQEEAIIIIDDVRLFGLKLDEDWRNITKDKLLDIIKLRTKKVYYLDSEHAKDDRMIIHINAK